MEYKGNTLETPFLRNGQVEIDPYFPDPGLIEAVNLALYLKRPLLLMGEPGCGKTRLAEAVAFDLHGENYLDHFRTWYVKSTTKAREGIYTFDAIARLRLTQLETDNQALQKTLQKKGKELEDYYTEAGILRKGPLSEAFDLSSAEKPAVLLIDEVDKADIDFPNDLLLELDKTTYYIPETDTYTRRQKKDAPLIIITSNNEKELPPAFLRRCLFHYIRFPGEGQLRQILNGIFPNDPQQIQEDTVDAFLKVRDRLIQGLSQKKLSTSELIDWYAGLQEKKRRDATFEGQPIEQALAHTIEQLNQKAPKVTIPLYQVLLKNWESIVSLLPEAQYQGEST
jgi:MoxR-like ATPase